MEQGISSQMVPLILPITTAERKKLDECNSMVIDNSLNMSLLVLSQVLSFSDISLTISKIQ